MKYNVMMMEVPCDCPFCSATTNVEVATNDYLQWRANALAQNVFSYLTASQLESLISGLCPSCQEGFSAEEAEG